MLLLLPHAGVRNNKYPRPYAPAPGEKYQKMSTSTAKDQWKLCEATKLCGGDFVQVSPNVGDIAKLTEEYLFSGIFGREGGP